MCKLLREKNCNIKDVNEICDAYIVNSCSVTSDTDRKVFKLIRRLIRNNPCAVICVTGCMAQLRPQDITKISDEVDIIVMGNERKQEIVDKLVDVLNKKNTTTTGWAVQKNVIVKPFTDSLIPTKLEEFSRTRAYVKIEDGCDAKCSYCTICKARGPVRLRPIEECVDEIRTLAQNGCKEIVLTGIEISAYTSLAELISVVDKIDGIERIRLSSIDPFYLNKKNIDAISKSKKLMPHFHISLQSGSSSILAKMRRKYNADTAKKNLVYLKEKFINCNLFADIIVGFPTETEDDFYETVDFIKEIEFLHLHIFPYSKRNGTEAAAMDGQIDESEKNKRAAILASIQKEIKLKLLNNAIYGNKRYKVLVETQNNKEAVGHTEEFFEVKINLEKNSCCCDLKGKIVDVTFVKEENETIIAELV